MKVCSIICLNFYFLILILYASARTCEERLESLENAVQSLIENQRNRFTENVDPKPMSQDNDRSLNLNNECQVLKQKLKDLEKSLERSNRRVHELETRVSELELSKENIWKAGLQQTPVVK